jgi:hypothetical protein
MVLISINPFGFKKTFLLVAALLGLSSALCFADPLFISSQFALPGHRSHRVASAAFSGTLEAGAASSLRAQDATLGSATNWLTCNPD